MERFVLPDMNKNYSVTKTLRLRYSLIEKLELVAGANNMSVNRLVSECIEFALRNLEVASAEEMQKEKEKVIV